MKKKYDFCLSIMLILMAFLIAMSGIRKKEESLASRIAPDILRFHVLANSDSPEDQALKLEVKDFLLEEIRDGVRAAGGNSASTASEFLTKSHIEQYICDNKTTLESAAKTYMTDRGFPYTAEIRLETCEFPAKTYGDMTFPAGTYDAVRVVLGDGAGQNFWCVLYPSLCYLDSTHAVVPDESKETLKSLLAEDDFEALLTARRPGSVIKKAEQESLLPRLTIRFKLADLIP